MPSSFPNVNLLNWSIPALSGAGMTRVCQPFVVLEEEE